MANPDAGDMIVAGAVAGLALLLSLGLAGIPFVSWLGAILVLVAGILMLQGRLGASGGVGTLLVILGPAYILVPPFMPAIGIILQIVTVVALWILVPLKLLRIW